MKRIFTLLTAALLMHTSLQATSQSPPQELRDYIERKDPSVKWELVDTIEAGVTRLYHLKLTSQTWQGMEWKHDLLLFVPAQRPVLGKVLLVNAGGKFDRNKIRSAGIGTMLSTQVQSPVAVLLGVPNQPLFNELKEDHLIAETFVRFLESGDASWPLLFPMVKSVVKAMDALQEFGRQELNVDFDEFLLSGASKRGWTTWLTAAVDPRIKAIAPMVIDVVNISPQLDHQIRSFGRPSEQILPYTERGLIPLPEGERSKRLWHIVDPYSYRNAYQMPKLVVLGNNDPYWTTDALNLYWDEIPGPKWISYTPNAGHNLIETNEAGEKLTPFPAKAIAATSAFTKLKFRGLLPPKIQWEKLEKLHQQGLKIQTEEKPLEARLWTAQSRNLDFRKSRWASKSLSLPENSNWEVWVDDLRDQHQAFYVDLRYELDGSSYWLSTQLQIQKPLQ